MGGGGGAENKLGIWGIHIIPSIDPPLVPTHHTWSTSPVCVQMVMALVGKQRLLKLIIALPPGLRHRCISLKTCRARRECVWVTQQHIIQPGLLHSTRHLLGLSVNGDLR